MLYVFAGGFGMAFAGTPTVNGLFYGDGDNLNYPSMPYATSTAGSYVYLTLQNGTLYVALVVDRVVNDAVWSPKSNSVYTISAGWSNHRTAKRAMDSEYASFTLTTDTGTNEQTWAWRQGSAGVSSGSMSYTNENWVSDTTVAGGLGSPPPSIDSYSSYAWNMSNYAYRVNNSIDPGWDMGIDDQYNWNSPFTNPGDHTDVVNASEGFPATGDITYSSTYEWEWSLVYEWSVDLTQFGATPVFVVTGTSHHSPGKNGYEDDPFPPGTNSLMDFGDLPDTYNTVLTNNGARHVIDVAGAYLGSNLDNDADGTPATSATDDDIQGLDDEDGIQLLSPMYPGSNAVIRVTVGSTGAFSAFIDFDGDGTLDTVTLVSSTGPTTLTPGTIGDMVLTNGTYDLTISIPSDAEGSMPGRFRITNTTGEGGNSVSGAASSGEVEDYVFPSSIGNRVWFDENDDGIQDSGDTNNLVNVPVQLVDTNGTLIASTTTDADGLYSFGDIPGGTYVVRFDLSTVTTNLGVVTANAGGNDALDSDGISGDTGGWVETAYYLQVPGQTNLTADLGVSLIGTTLAVVADVHAEWRGGAGYLVWKTDSEWNTAGFFVYLIDPETGVETRLNSTLIPSAFFAAGSMYEIEIPQAVEGDLSLLRLEEMELSGTVRGLGTHAVVFAEPPPVAMAAPIAMAAPLALAATVAPDPSSVLKVFVRNEGIYGIGLQAIADGMGRPLKAIQALAKNGNLQITCQGEPVPFHFDAEPGRILFYAEPTDNWYARDAAYLISKGSGLTMVRREPEATSGETVFPVQIRVEEDRYPFDSALTRPDDFYYWDYVISGHPSLGAREVALDLTGYAGGSLDLTIHLRGWSSTYNNPDHLAEFLFNGEVAGSVTFDGQETVSARLTIPAGWVEGGINTVTVKGVLQSGYTHSFFVLDSVDASFEHELVPLATSLLFGPDGSASVSAAAFTEPIAMALDANNTPAWIAEAEGGIPSKAWSVGTSERFAVIEADQVPMLEPEPAADDAWFMDTSSRVDYLLITSRALEAAAQSLADYRTEQGLSTGVAVFEDVCDLITHGLRTPEAVPALLCYARDHWIQPPWMTVLAGNGHYDYLGTLGNEANHIPPMLFDTRDGLFASDGLLADCNGDNLPDIAIGRLPALTAVDLTAMIAKIKAYEAGFGSTIEDILVFAADINDSAGNFSSANTSLANWAGDDHAVEQIDLNTTEIEDARMQLLAKFNRGAGFIHYTGHGGVNNFSAKKLLKASDVTAMNNPDTPPVVVALSCLVGRYEAPGVNGMGEVLMRKAGAGAVAVWGPSGLSRNNPAVDLGNAFYRTILQDGCGTLGLAIQKARSSVIGDQFTKDTFAIYNLLGDPSLRIAGNTAGQPCDRNFAQWRWQRFAPGTLVNPELSGVEGDANGNGQNNFLEYAFGGNPHESGTVVPTLKVLRGKPDGKGWARFLWRQRVLRSDLEYRLRVSDDLVNWQPAPEALQILSTLPVGDGVIEEVTARLPFEGKKVYLKLDITQK